MKKLKILMLEDNKLDAELIKEEMTEHKIDFTSELVDTEKDFIAAIHNFKPDIILSDYSLPQFTGFEALDIAKELAPDIPFIIVTGSLTEETAVESIKRGAWNYVIKENLHRLTPAIENACNLKVEKDKNKQAEEEIRKLSIVVETTPEAIVMTDMQGMIEYVNKGLLAIGGFEDDNTIIGKSIFMFSNEEGVKQLKEEIIPTILSKEKWRGEVSVKRKDSSFFPAEMICSYILDEEGNPKYLLSQYHDITNRKKAEAKLRESEEKLRLMIDNSHIGFSATDLNGNFIEVNPAVCNMTGYSSEEMLHKHFDKFTHPDDRAKNKELNKKLLENKIPHFDLEKRYIHKKGNIVNVLIRSQIVRNEKGKPLFEMAITENITKRKLAEEQIAKDLKIKTALLQELYHRTKNNMQVVSSMLKIQLRNIDNRVLSGSEGIEYMHDSFNEIINKIKAMSLVHEKLYQAKDLSHINLKEYIRDLVRYLMRGYNIRVEKVILKMELDDVFVLIDSAIPLGLVLNEIISNVFKHAFPHSKNDELFIKLYKEEDETINIHLSDNGVGIPNDFDLKNVNTMGLQTVFSLTEHQLNGEVRYDTKKGLKWHISFKDNMHKERV